VEKHKLLSRQLKRTFGAEIPQDEKFQAFLKLINESYHYNDTDRQLLERAMVLSSEELSLANKQLQLDADNQKELLDKVLEAIVLLARNDQEVALIKELSKSESSYHLLNLVEHLQVLAEEQRRTEKLLLLQEARMSEAQQLANFGTWVYTIGTGEADWTPNLCTIFERENFIGFDLYNYTQLVYKEDLKEVDYALSYLFVKGITTITHRIVGKNGEVKWIEASFKLIYDENNNPITILGTALDITRLKQAESALEYKINELEETGAFLDTLIEEMPVAVLVKDAITREYITVI
jgi:PAS domain-containing protein